MTGIQVFEGDGVQPPVETSKVIKCFSDGAFIGYFSSFEERSRERGKTDLKVVVATNRRRASIYFSELYLAETIDKIRTLEPDLRLETEDE